MKKRLDGRTSHAIRKLQVSYDPFGYSDGSVLLSLGSTKVLASVTLQTGVPFFLKGKGKGWLTAEYAMLPTATRQRSIRESANMQKNGRSVEISRLIGRSLRTVVSSDLLGEKTIYIDCDVLQADGSTRVASIMAASIALHRAQNKWLERNRIKEPIIKDTLLAVSVGVTRDNEILVDLNQVEDNQVIADFNFVMTMQKNIIEIQGTAEKRPLSSDQFDQLKSAALDAVDPLNASLAEYIEVQESKQHAKNNFVRPASKTGLFSLEQRIEKAV
ncbi:ribonuclease PH [Candidatus Dependentiae bacterium]|nr:MAG: ribonuclease PH [Candidatus Dependentiae bacterium]